MPLLYIREDTTVGDIKKFLANIPDESRVFTQSRGENINIRLDDYPIDNNTHELYIEEV